MFGSVSEWFYKGLVGIRPADDAVGFDHVAIAPYPFVETTHGVDWAKGSYRSVRGTIKCEWRRQGNGFELEVTVPPNVRATVIMPTSDPASVTEQGTPVAKAKGVNSARPVAGGLSLEVGSGSYEFASRVAPR
jgi:alpha-L-rhamnosidase